MSFEPTKIDSIAELRPDMREFVRDWLASLSMRGIRIRILETRRSRERQDFLYAQGRTRPGVIVTHKTGDDPTARHVCEPEEATALDFCFTGPDPWSGPWEEVGSVWEAITAHRGGRWGGRWKMRDLGHIEIDAPAVPTPETVSV